MWTVKLTVDELAMGSHALLEATVRMWLPWESPVMVAVTVTPEVVTKPLFMLSKSWLTSEPSI